MDSTQCTALVQEGWAKLFEDLSKCNHLHWPLDFTMIKVLPPPPPPRQKKERWWVQGRSIQPQKNRLAAARMARAKAPPPQSAHPAPWRRSPRSSYRSPEKSSKWEALEKATLPFRLPVNQAKLLPSKNTTPKPHNSARMVVWRFGFPFRTPQVRGDTDQ